jgi:hypothetical protein
LIRIAKNQAIVAKAQRRVSAACLPNFFKSRSNVSRSFFESTPATSLIGKSNRRGTVHLAEINFRADLN